MKIQEFRQLEASLSELQTVTEFSVTPTETVWPDKVEKVSQINVSGSGEFTSLLAQWLNDNQATILDAIKANAAKRLEEARLEAVREAESFITAEKAALDDLYYLRSSGRG